MNKHESEADARILIDALLRQAGWDPTDKSQVRTEVSVTGAAALKDATDDARIVSGFYSQRDLERLLYLRKEAKPLATIAIPDDYLRLGEVRIVRPYQKEVLRALDHAVELGKRRFLIELPTGTGKTDVIC